MEMTMFIRIEATRQVALLSAVALISVATTAAAQAIPFSHGGMPGLVAGNRQNPQRLRCPPPLRAHSSASRAQTWSRPLRSRRCKTVVVSRDTIDASGQQARCPHSCTGGSARWSADVRRVYLRSELELRGSGLKRIGAGHTRYLTHWRMARRSERERRPRG
jgi:hypothetical protein